MITENTREILKGVHWPITTRDLKTVLISNGLCRSHDIADRIVNKWLGDGILIKLDPLRVRDFYVKWNEPKPTRMQNFGEDNFEVIKDRHYPVKPLSELWRD